MIRAGLDTPLRRAPAVAARVPEHRGNLPSLDCLQRLRGGFIFSQRLAEPGGVEVGQGQIEHHQIRSPIAYHRRGCRSLDLQMHQKTCGTKRLHHATSARGIGTRNESRTGFMIAHGSPSAGV
jgi:hypothetical protein